MKKWVCAVLACIMAVLICMPLPAIAASDEKMLVSLEADVSADHRTIAGGQSAAYENRMGVDEAGGSVLLMADSNDSAGRILLAAVLAMLGGAVCILNRGKNEKKD